MFIFKSKQPASSPAVRKLQQLMQWLGEDTAPPQIQTSVADPNPETIADDGVITPEVAAQIAQDEPLVRRVLQLVGVDYDALIRLPNDAATDAAAVANGSLSPYAAAIQAQPGLLAEILRAPRPVLAAVEVALQFQPYADFMHKYGAEPQEIRRKLKAELQQELAGQGAEPTPAPRALMPAVPFSQASRSAQPLHRPKTATRLEDIFRAA